jgi:putative endonuclease
MPGLAPGIHALVQCRDGGWLRLLHDQPTSRCVVHRRDQHFARRPFEHREGSIAGFTKRYALKILVYYEPFDDIRDAIQREKVIKHWPRGRKVQLLEAKNPEWKDLYDTLI